MPKTTVEVRYPHELGEITLRGGQAPLSWSRSLAPTSVSGDRHVFEIDLPEGALLEFKPVRDGRRWSRERNYTVLAGERVTVEPYFDRTRSSVEAFVRTMSCRELGRTLAFQVLLPPSYDEHTQKRYPVLYAQDGQALFSTGADPIDGTSWKMDETLDELYEIGAIEEIIVVGIHTTERRMEMLSPTPDPKHGGGDAPRYLDFLVERMKPWVDRTYRARPEPASTAVLGASMGGLFSFFAAWTRPDVFGKAACLSGSFWWDRRCMIREVQRGSCPAPRPALYIDSGAARTNFEEDANAVDGLHHTLALRQALVTHCYAPGTNLHTLAFPGLRHNNVSWGMRLPIPLQILFPRRA